MLKAGLRKPGWGRFAALLFVGCMILGRLSREDSQGRQWSQSLISALTPAATFAQPKGTGKANPTSTATSTKSSGPSEEPTGKGPQDLFAKKDQENSRRDATRKEVEAAFEARQREQTAELQALQERLRVVERQLAERARLKQQIIDRRVDELLNPGLKWDEAPHTPGQVQPHNPVSPPDYGGKPATVNPELTLGEIDLYARAANLETIGKAMQAYQAATKHFPPQALRDKAGKPLLSWRVLVLPYLGEERLYKEFKLDQPWDSDHNLRLSARIPQVYAATRRSPIRKAESTTVLVPAGGDFPSGYEKGAQLRNFVDGLSNTILVVDCANDESAVIWTKPGDWEAEGKRSTQMLFGPSQTASCAALFADGVVRRLTPDIPAKQLTALLTDHGGEAVKQPAEIDPRQIALDNNRQKSVPSKSDLIVMVIDSRVSVDGRQIDTLQGLRDRLLQAQKENPDQRAFLRSALPPKWETIRRLQSLCYTLGIESIVGVNRRRPSPSGAEWNEEPIIAEAGSPTLSATAWAQQPLNIHSRNQALILKTLTKKSSVAFVDTQLRDAIKFVQEQHGVNILIDEAALSEDSIRLDSPITLNLSDATLLSILNLILPPRKLGFTIDDEVLKITTVSALRSDRFQDELNQLATLTPSIQDKHARIAAILNKPTSIAFVDTQLKDALKFLAEQQHIDVLIDDNSLNEESIPQDSPINLQLSDVTSRSVLNLMLRPLKLTYSIENEVLMIKAASTEAGVLAEHVVPAQGAGPTKKIDRSATGHEASKAAAGEHQPAVEPEKGKKTNAVGGGEDVRTGFSKNLPNFIMMTPSQFRKAMVDAEEAMAKAQIDLKAKLPPGGKIDAEFLQLHEEDAKKVTRLVSELDALRQDQHLQLKMIAIHNEHLDSAFKVAEAKLAVVKRAFENAKATQTAVLEATREVADAKADFEQSRALLEAYRNSGGVRGEERLRRALDSRMSVSFVNTELKDALKFISEQHKTINLVIDAQALAAEKIAADAEINLDIRDVMLSNVLKLMLDPLKLTYVVENEAIKITTLKEAAAAAERRRLAELARERLPLETKSKENDPTESVTNDQFMKSPRDVGAILAMMGHEFLTAQKALAAGRKQQVPADRIAELDKEVAYRRKRLAAIVEEQETQVQVLQIQLARTELLRKKAETEYNRMENLHHAGTVTDIDLKGKRADLDLAKLREQELKKLVDLFIKLSGDEAKEAKALLTPDELSKPGAKAPGGPGAARRIKLGLTFAQVAAKDLPGQFSVKYSGGLRVTAVDANSVGAQAGVKVGDVLVGLGTYYVTSQENVDWTLDSISRSTDTVHKVYLIRDKELVYGVLRVPADTAEAKATP